jgi:hypothetical protein
MKRDYDTGESSNVIFFVGEEVEHTPAYGMRTLFVTGVQSITEIQDWLDDFNSFEDKTKHIEHIFFGANHSYNPQTYDEHKQWEEMIFHFLDKDYLCSLDIAFNQVEEFHESGFCEYDNFIPQIRVPIPYIRLWNYNTMLKIDDKDFKATNPGVWSHSLHKLMNRDVFTDWSMYKNDKVMK